MSKTGRNPTISFRPSDVANENIETYMREHSIKSRSGGVNGIIEQHGAKSPEDATGDIMECPKRPMAIGLGRSEVTVRTPVDSSVCRTCEKYPCDAWKWNESSKRVSEWRPVKR